MFGSAKRKLDLPPRDDSNFYHHDCVNFNVPKLMKRASASQCCTALMLPTVFTTEDLAMPIALSTSRSGPVWSRNGFPIVESLCTNLMDLRIERN